MLGSENAHARAPHGRLRWSATAEWLRDVIKRMRDGIRVRDAGGVARIRGSSCAHLAALPLRFLEPPIFTIDGSSRDGGARERGAARLLVPTIHLNQGQARTGFTVNDSRPVYETSALTEAQ